MNPRILFIFISCLLINTLSSQNLISNGNFESGNGVSFQSDYVFTNPTGQVNSNPREYALLTNPFLMNSNNFVNAVDHTSGTGLMMVCDGASGQSEIFWKTNGDVLLQGGQNYRFTYYVHSVNNTAPQAEIGFRVMSGGTATFSNTYVITSPASGWQEVTYDFLVTGTGNQYRRLELYNVNPSAVGNDFAIDDISLERLAALQARYSVINSSCFGANDGSIVIYGVGGSGIYTSYSIAGTVNLTNTTGVFINLPNGTYTVSVTDNLGVTATIPGVIVVQPANLTLTSNSAICPGSSINLTVSGGSNYNWTASPADPSMTDTTSPTITVSPTVATTYTVTSTQTGPRNLVFNGDFSQGDLGFTSDYQFLAPNNPSGIQGAYGIVNNSQTWFAGFSSCTDHTSGTGNMLVADGSINAAPNDKIWCQTIPVTPGQNYTFSYWVQTVVTGNQANIDVVINGVSVGANSTPAGTCNWIQRTFTWNSGASTVAEICLIDTIVAGNDFAIDDISFTVNATCSLSASVDITITASSATATFGTSTTICPGSSGTLTFNGTPGGIVIFQSSTGANYNVLLNAAGTATWTSPILNVTTIYTLQSIFLPSTGCSTPLTGMVTFTVEVNGCATVLTGGIDVNDPNIPPSCIPGTCIDLSASYVDFGSTSSYAASQITYCPYPFTGPNYTNVTVTGGDDFWSEIINLPFDFCYYNNVYTTCHAGTNGLITFRPVTAGGFCDWPDTSIPINAITNQSQSIFGVFQDTDFSIPPAAPNRAVNYRLEGTYPCRKLIVNFYNMGQWNSTGSAPGLQTSQIVLYEISNIIEVFVQRRVAGTPWAGTGLIGLIGASGAQSIAAPGRDAGNWSAFNEAWRFTPNGPSATTFQWLENGVPISSNTSIVVCPTVTTTYTAEVTYNQCGQIYSVSSSATVTVFDDDTQAPDDLSECNNPFDLTENTAIILGALDPNDYEVNYFLTAADAQLGINIIANPTAFNSTSNPQTIYAGVQNYNTGCNLVKPFDLIISTCTLDPQPTPLFACDDNPVDGFTLFDLTAADTNALNGADPALFTVSYHNSQPDADTGNLPINPATAYSGTDGEIIYVRVEENAVPTTYGTTSFALTINPTPFIADVTQTICSGDTFTVTPVNTAPDVVPMGTTYTWTVSAPVGVTGASDQATPQTTISQTLTNTNATPQDVIYSVTASVGTAPNVCTDTFTITITVNPKPLIADVTQSICTGNTFTVTPANTLPDVVPTGTTYTWTVVAGAVTGASNQATPQTTISQTLSNATANSIDVVYTVTASVGTVPNVCTDTFTITVTVNPEPLIADVVQTICSGDTFTVTPVNTAPDVVPTGTTYTWTVSAPVGVTGASDQASPQTSISQTLTNTNATPQDVIYSVTASVGTAPNVCTDTFTITITVNPKPLIADVTQSICTGNTFTVTPANTLPDVVPTGTTYTWTVVAGAVTGASDQATPQTTISQTLSNATANSIDVVYTVTASVGTVPNVCTDIFTITVTVNPEPLIADVVQTICSGDTFTVTPANTAPDVVPTGTTYTWTVTAPVGVSGASNQATPQTSISQTLSNSASTSLDVVYTVTASVGTTPTVCTASFTITVTVNPEPLIADVTQVICSTDTFTFTPTNTLPDVVPTGTTYTWSVSAPAGVTGASNQTTPQTSISQTLINTNATPQDVVYTVTASVGTAPTICTDSFSITVTVNPNPQIAAVTQSICSAETFTVTPTNTAPDVVPTGTTYTWSVTAPVGITGASNQATPQTSISQTLTNTTVASLDVVYTVTASFGVAPNVCSSTFTITVSVTPNPQIADVTQTICSTDTFTVTPANTLPDVVPTGTTYTWSAAAPAGVTGASNQTTPQTSISQTLTNTTSSALDVVYTVTASVGTAPNVCTDTFTITVTVNPKPSITNQTAVICTGSTFTISPTNTPPNVVPLGTTYTWTVTAPAGITGAADQLLPQANISQTLNNTTNTAINVVYTVTASSGITPTACTSTFTITVTVNPSPVIANITQTICSATAFSVTPTNTLPDVVPTGTSYTWSVATPTGITGASNQATPQTSISQTLTNTTSAAINVIYTVTATSGVAPNTCTGSFTITVTVNPRPSIANTVQTICSADTFTVLPTNTAPDVVPTGTTYTWSVTAPTGITGASNQTTPQTTISQTLENTTTSPLTVVYTVTATSGVAPIECLATFTVSVTVRPVPTASIAGDSVLCPSTEATVTFNGTPGATVEYTVDGSAVQTLELDGSGFGSLTDTYTTTTVITLVGVFSGTNPTCSAVLNQSVTLTVSPAPVINTPADLVNCDDNNDGISIFDLTQTIAFITGGNPNVTVTFHETMQDALLGGAPIPTPGNYTSITPSVQIIYIRVVNTGTTDCPSVTTFNLIVNPYPIINTTPTAYPLCDWNSDGQEVFNLTTTITGILDGLDPALHTVTFYATEAEAEAATPQLTGIAAYLSSSQTIWVRVEVIATGCYDVAPLELIVNALPIANIPTPLSLCDVNNPGDERETFDLTLAIDDIVGAQEGLEVSFHLTLAQAQAGTDALPTTYTNTSNAQAIHVRVFDPVTGCYATTLLDLRVEPLPFLFPIAPTELCDENNDGLASFDLAALITPLLNGASPLDITVTFHETQQQAQDGSDSIDTTILYPSIEQGQQALYVRAEDNLTGCFSIRAISLVVNPRPEMPTLDNLTLCDTDNNTQNGLSRFDLTVQTPVILAAQPQGASAYQVRYYTTEQNAVDNIAWIANPASYANTSNPQTIWVRVTDLATGCFETGSFELIVDIPLALTFPTPLSLCDESLPNDGFTLFDLTIRDNDITQGLGGYTVTYYPNYQNALDDINAIQNPQTYTNAIVTVQTLGVRVTSPAGCHSYTTLTIRVLPLPEPRTMPEALEACDDNNPGDGIEVFDLTLRANYILNGASLTEFALTYYENESDANNAINEILDPANYSNTTPNTQTIWVRVTRIPGVNEPSCYQLVELQLIVNPLPIIAESPIAFYQCEPIDDFAMAFVLSTMNPRVLGTTQAAADYTVSYYLTAADALAGTPSLPNVYTNISSPQTIYVRVVNNDTGCVNATGEVILEVEEGTQANPLPIDAPETTVCDTIGDNDGIYTFDLSGTVSPLLIGTNNPVGTTVYYYENLADAQQATVDNDYSGAIATPEAYNNTTPQQQTIYAVLVNPATSSSCPTIIPVPLTIYLLPEPTPEGGTICLDPETGELLNDFTLDSNLDPLTHTFVWTDAQGVEVGTTASITVTEPGVYTVVATNSVTGCVSEPTTAEVIYSQQAVVTYQVSNYFSENQTITVIATGVTTPNQNNGNYLYSIDYGPFQTSNVFTNVSSGWHYITVQDTNGCLDTTIQAFIIDYPKFFTPNGDGQNDTWNIFSLRDVNPNAKIYIFDRYGKFIKQISPLGVGWDGTFNGEALPSTDYWFSVEYEEQGDAKVFRAHFSLKR